MDGGNFPPGFVLRSISCITDAKGRVSGGAWGAPKHPPPSGFGGGMTSGPGDHLQDLPPVIPNPTVGGGWNGSSHAAGSFGWTSEPRSQYLPPDFYNPTVGGWWGPPSHAFGSSVGGAGSGPGSLIYGSPYSNGEGVREDGDEDSITALPVNTKMNATFGMDVGSREGGSERKTLKNHGPPYSNGEDIGDEDPITALNTKMNATMGMDVGSREGGSGRKILKKGQKKR